MRMPRCASASAELEVVQVEAGEDEVRLRRHRLESRVREQPGQRRARRRHLVAPRSDGVGRTQARARRGERGAVDVEGLLDDVEVGDERRDPRARTRAAAPRARRASRSCAGRPPAARPRRLARDGCAAPGERNRRRPRRRPRRTDPAARRGTPSTPRHRACVPSGCSGRRSTRSARPPPAPASPARARSSVRSCSRTGTRSTRAPRVAEICAYRPYVSSGTTTRSPGRRRVLATIPMSARLPCAGTT